MNFDLIVQSIKQTCNFWITNFSVGLNQTLELSEMTRQQLEEEIQALNREKGDISEHLSSVSMKTINRFLL